MSGTPKNLILRWACGNDDPRELASFFMQNAPPEYISHGEIQDGRAEKMGVWSAKLEAILTDQFQNGCARRGDGKFTETRLALARWQDSLAAIAYVGLERAAPTPYAILYDLLVRSDLRSLNIGSQVLSWIEQQLRAEQIAVVFLESGINNHRAHSFFKREGYSVMSISMVKALQT